MDEESFKRAITISKIPILVLDNKWHRLFAVHGKTEEVLLLEKDIRDLLARQGQLNSDLKNLKKVKNQLMQNIVSNMGENQEEQVAENHSQAMAENKRLIEETNSKMDEVEDELLEIPKTINEKNKELMLLTMAYCYSYLRKNKEESEEIDAWIKDVRIKLKKNIIRKQNRKINNKEMYSYMHDIFGKDVINLFDVRYEDFEEAQKKLEELNAGKSGEGSKEDSEDSASENKFTEEEKDPFEKNNEQGGDDE